MSVPVGAHDVSAWRRLLPWGIAAALLAALIATWVLRPRAPAPRPIRLDVQIGRVEQLVVDENVDGAVAVLSPDGQTLAYLGTAGTERHIFVRPLDRLDSTLLSGTDNATQPFFSPDGQSIAFFASGVLKRISVAGGPPIPIVQAVDARGGAWGPDDTIVYAPAGTGGLLRVPTVGGAPVELTRLETGERTHRWPAFLPGGEAVLFMCQMHAGAYDDGTIEAVRIATGERKVLIRGGTFPHYLASGHLIYTRGDTVFVVGFDPARFEVRGEPQPLLTGVLSSGAGVGAGTGSGASQIAVAANGTAIYIPGDGTETGGLALAVLDRTGSTVFTFPEKRAYRDPRFSPDASRIAVRVGDGKTEQIEVLDIARGTLTRLTADGTLNGMPTWSPDGQFLAYYSDRSGKGLQIYMSRSDGGGEVRALTSGGMHVPRSFSADGRRLAGFLIDPGTNMDLMVVGVDEGAITPFLTSPAIEWLPAFSPDGRWIAYQSGEANGIPEIFLRGYPEGGGHRLVSTGGGTVPVWTKQGREIVYVAPGADARIMAVDVTPDGATLSLGQPRRLFDVPLWTSSNTTAFDATADGTRFAVILSEGDASITRRSRLTIVFNLFEEIQRVLGGS